MRVVRSMVRSAMALCVVLVLGAGSAEATMLGLPQGYPDITANFFTTTYNSVTGDFNVGPWLGSIDSLLYYSDPPTYNNEPIGGTTAYSISANFQNDGTGLLPGSSVWITGDPGFGQQTPLLAGTILQIGFNGTGISDSTALEFLVSVTGGLAEFGSTAGIKITQLAFGGPDRNSLYTSDEGVADNFASVPEPVTLALFGLGLTYVASRRRKPTRH